MNKSTAHLLIALVVGFSAVFLLHISMVTISPVLAANNSYPGSVSGYPDLLAPPPDVYTVTTVTDKNDGCAAAPGDCSLREAIIKANTDVGAGLINFDIVGGCAGGCTIVVNPPASGLGALPSLTDNSGVEIDGYSQTGAIEATSSTSATLKIELDGTNVTGFNGINILSDNNAIRGLAINRFGLAGISIWGAAVNGNDITGNHIGTNLKGTASRANRGGIVIGASAYDNIVGGDQAKYRNVISGNVSNGISLGFNYLGTDYIAIDNVIRGNYIGTDATGTSDVGNILDGIYIHSGSYDNTIMDNLISGNNLDGVYIHGAMTTTLTGNYVGVNEAGSADLGNNWHGVRVDGGSQNNQIGGDSEMERNVISGNGPGGEGVYSCGVKITGSSTMSNTVSGNYIGVSASSAFTIPNQHYGVMIDGSSKYNIIGGDAPDEGNVVSGNGWDGIVIQGAGTNHNIVAGNRIGTNASGTTSLKNGFEGVWISMGAQYNTIGGDTNYERNIISGNDDNGISINSENTMYNVISGNYIGTDVNGSAQLPNGINGLEISDGPRYNLVGGNTEGERNIISGNSRTGINIAGSTTMSNTISGNYIGVDYSGTSRLRNGEYGVALRNETKYNRIGGTEEGEGNLIGGSAIFGLFIANPGTSFNQILGNYIGTDASGVYNLYNPIGINIYDSASQNTIGPGNTIAFNILVGIVVQTTATIDNVFTQNSIYSNGDMGIDIQDSAHENIQPPSISDTSWGSVEISGTACANCLVEVFSNPDTDGEGKHFIGDTLANGSGNFSLTVSHLLFPYLTATATDPISGTSEFSAVFESDFLALFLPLVLR